MTNILLFLLLQKFIAFFLKKISIYPAFATCSCPKTGENARLALSAAVPAFLTPLAAVDEQLC